MDSTLEDKLERLGLSDKEVDTYLAILHHGSAKASTIAADAGVSKRYVYSIGERLESRGFVEVDDHVRPTLIRARPPEEVLSALTEDINDLRPGLEARFSESEPDLEPIEVIKSRRTVIKRLRTLLEAAQEEVTLSVPPTVLSELEDTIADVRDRDVLVLLLLSGGETEEAPVHLGSATRHWTEQTPLMLSADMMSSLIAPYHMMVGAGKDAQAITLSQQQLSPVITGSFLGNYWPVAEEAHVTDPLEFPHTFENFRHAVFQAALHTREGGELAARAEVRPVRSDGPYESIEGRVVEVRQGIVSPVTSSFPVENGLVLETEEGRVSVGGDAAFVEEVSARQIELAVIDDTDDHGDEDDGHDEHHE